MSPAQRPGKTAPCLVHDIQRYDPVHPSPTGRNLLSDVPPALPEDYKGGYLISPDACYHNHITKVSQTAFTGSPSKLSALCLKCRHHVQITLSHWSLGSSRSADHLHHLVYQGGKQGDNLTHEDCTAKGQSVETFYYDCSYLTCSARVFISIASPILNNRWVHLLTDPNVIRKRTEEATAAHRERLEGMAQPLPIEVLTNLRTYILNALQESERSKPISAVNKRFMGSFGLEGQPCKDLLEFLEFSYKDEGFWHPPRPETPREYPYRDPLRIFLDDVVHELSSLIYQRPPSEKKGNKEQYDDPAYNNMRSVLESRDYPKAFRLNEFKMPSTTCYEDLGTIEDMSSVAIIEAYNRQISVDPGRTGLYLKSLRSIGDLRVGPEADAINQAVQTAYSQGKYTHDDVFFAYYYFRLHPGDASLTDDTIIQRFHAYLHDTAHENEARHQLWIIGDSRRSELIKSAAEDRVSTVEQAQIFLGVDENTPDDFVVTMYTSKITDAPATRDLARRAVELIADNRKSTFLSRFAATGSTGDEEMDVGEAYRLLQIPDRTADEGAIVAAYTICVDEAPHQAETYHRALKIICDETNSPTLKSMVSGSVSQPDREPSNWPVGLENIGNTCYLNSLLQFYFSVRPFREMVLDFENFKMDLNGVTSSQKKVGSRKVLRKEVERSQWFVRELGNLFNDMITSSQSFVIPGKQLARLTLVSPSNEAAIRRRSTLSANKPAELGEINGMPVMGPLGPPQNSGDSQSSAPNNQAPPVISEEESENIPPQAASKTDVAMPQAEDKQCERRQSDVVMTDSHDEHAPQDPDSIPPEQPAPAPVSPSKEPPPVPPRPIPEADRQRQLLEEVEIGAQQDVTEAINNVLFQSQCAIKPISFFPDGEQLDQVKDLFYGRSKSYISTEKGSRSKEEWWCDVKVDVASGTRDIYAAMDGAFDAQKILVDNAVAEQHSAISKLPPVLQVQVQRVQFDQVKKSSFKSTHHLDLKETIYLDRYMDTQRPEVIKRRRENWELKSSLRDLEDRRQELLRQSETDGQDMSTLFTSAQDVLRDLDGQESPEASEDGLQVEQQLLTELGQLSHIARSELTFVEEEIKGTREMISRQFDDDNYKNLPYRLYAVFIHRGSVNFGHYWIYIYDFNKEVWRKYNDTVVTEVQPDEIFKYQDERNPPTPYFLVYVNDRMKDRLVDPVCREILDQQPPPAQDTAGDAQTEWDGANSAGETTQSGDVDMDQPETGTGDAAADLSNASPTSASKTNPLKRKGFEDVMDVSLASSNLL